MESNTDRRAKIKALEVEIDELYKKRHDAVSRQNFPEAAGYRDQEAEVRTEMFNLIMECL